MRKRKANAILEYAFIIMIVMGVLTSLNYIIKRTVQARVKDHTDKEISLDGVAGGHGLEWPGTSLTWSGAESRSDRNESLGGSLLIDADSNSHNFSIFIPVPSIQGISPMKHKNATRDIQDVAVKPSPPNYPGHKRTHDGSKTETDNFPNPAPSPPPLEIPPGMSLT